MTTHEEQSLIDSHDGSEAAVEATPPQQGQHSAPVESAEPTTAPPEQAELAEPAQPAQPAEPTMAPAEPTHAQDPTARPESSTEELLFADDDLADLRARWAAVQASFVDDPKDCVEKADDLVSDLVEQLTSSFANARSRLEEQWARGEQASTEDLRLALMHYREFFERLLEV
jgi:hypothetical protein